jgi:hypothetical protein
MNIPRPSAKALAMEVIQRETRDDDKVDVAVTVLPKLHGTLGKLIGAHGFDVVLERSLRLAKNDEPLLANVICEPGGILNGLTYLAADRERGLIVVLSHLIELLMRFIGEDLAGRIVRDTWSDATSATEAKETK